MPNPSEPNSESWVIYLPKPPYCSRNLWMFAAGACVVLAVVVIFVFESPAQDPDRPFSWGSMILPAGFIGALAAVGIYTARKVSQHRKQVEASVYNLGIYIFPEYMVEIRDGRRAGRSAFQRSNIASVETFTEVKSRKANTGSNRTTGSSSTSWFYYRVRLRLNKGEGAFSSPATHVLDILENNTKTQELLAALLKLWLQGAEPNVLQEVAEPFQILGKGYIPVKLPSRAAVAAS